MRERQLVSTCKQEQVRLQRLAQHWRQKQQSAVPKEAAVEEVRLHHVGLFLLLNGVPVQPYVRRAVLEQFAHPALEEDPVGKLVRQVSTQVEICACCAVLYREPQLDLSSPKLNTPPGLTFLFQMRF